MPGSRDLGTELRDELLNDEIFYSLKEAQIVVEQWRQHYNTVRPHSSLGYRPPAPQAFNPFLPPRDQVAPMQLFLYFAGTKNPSGHCSEELRCFVANRYHPDRKACTSEAL